MPGVEWLNGGVNSNDEVDGRLEIWLLTGWYLNLLVSIFLGGSRHWMRATLGRINRCNNITFFLEI